MPEKSLFNAIQLLMSNPQVVNQLLGMYHCQANYASGDHQQQYNDSTTHVFSTLHQDQPTNTDEDDVFSVLTCDYNSPTIFTPCNPSTSSSSPTCSSVSVSPQSSPTHSQSSQDAFSSTHDHQSLPNIPCDIDTLLNQTFLFEGREYCLIEKEEYDQLSKVRKRKSSGKKNVKRKKGLRSRSEYEIDGTNVTFLVEGIPSFHTAQDISFVNREERRVLKSKLVKIYLNNEEKKIPHSDNSQIGSSKTFNSKSAGIYRMVFKVESLSRLVEWEVETKWEGYRESNSFKSLDVINSKVYLV